MAEQPDIEKLAETIAAIRQNAEALRALAVDIPAVDRNVERILACVRMLEIDISDVANL